MNKGIIYCARCIASNKFYVGQTTRALEERKKQHLFTKDSVDTAFSRAIRKYGFDNFVWTVLYKNIPIEKLDSLETEMIKKLNSFKEGYNSTTGGQPQQQLSDSTKYKISKNNARYWKNKEFSKEHREKLKENHKGMLGKSHSTESKLKMSKNNGKHWKGKKLSQEHRKKMSEARKRYLKQCQN